MKSQHSILELGTFSAAIASVGLAAALVGFVLLFSWPELVAELETAQAGALSSAAAPMPVRAGSEPSVPSASPAVPTKSANR
jgi:hypothetical protein